MLRTLGKTLAVALAAVALTAAAAPGNATPADPAGSSTAAVGPGSYPLTWQQIHDRMMTWVDNKNITYSQSGTYPGPAGNARYRRDCSGFVSMALMLPPSGPTTVYLTGYVHRIEFSQLQAGDLIGRLGAGTEGDNGHVRIFINWADQQHTKVRVAEQGWVSNPNYPHISIRPAREYLNGVLMVPYRYNHKR